MSQVESAQPVVNKTKKGSKAEKIEKVAVSEEKVDPTQVEEAPSTTDKATEKVEEKTKDSVEEDVEDNKRKECSQGDENESEVKKQKTEEEDKTSKSQTEDEVTSTTEQS